MNFDAARIGDELIRFSKIKDTDKNVWKLVDCKRGFGSTDALSHEAGTDMSGTGRCLWTMSGS